MLILNYRLHFNESRTCGHNLKAMKAKSDETLKVIFKSVKSYKILLCVYFFSNIMITYFKVFLHEFILIKEKHPESVDLCQAAHFIL